MKNIPAIDEPNSLTCIEDFSEMIDHLVEKDETGIYNCCNTGIVSPYDVAVAIKKYINHNLEITKVDYEDLLKMLPNRRVNTILSCKKLIQSGYVPRDAKDALIWCVKGYGAM
jgi:dTDP-4-dehydrorhamnose reductase